MRIFAVYQLSALLLASFFAAYAALWLLARLASSENRAAEGFMVAPENSVTFLFDNENLVDATDSASQMLVAAPAGASDWTRLLSLLLPRFPGLENQIASLPDAGEVALLSCDENTRLEAQWRNGLARIELMDAGRETVMATLDQNSLNAMEQELETLRATAQTAPFLVWRQERNGAVVWANNAYLALARDGEPDAQITPWPPARLFDVSQLAEPGHNQQSQRVTTRLPGEAEPRWFECFATRLGEETLYTAIAADKVVKAEVALRDFVQTLTKTFAHLTIGLAIFDKQRRLALFNPALTDLTMLPPEFLSARPTLRAVLDRLREKKMLPEPKDYRSWRQRLYELEAAAANGTYEETWSLASGQTYRVTGRPHPDGAVAFLFEDISAEISLTRRFRAELETGQATIDAIDEAIAVFSPSGILTLSNAAYARLWAVDPGEIIGNFSIVDATRSWAEKCAPTPVWGDAREYVGAIGERVEWDCSVRLNDGRSVICRFKPISGGATLAGFTISRHDTAPAEIATPRLNLSVAPVSA